MPGVYYTVVIFGLRSRFQTQARINNLIAEVDYLVTVETGLVMTSLQGFLYIGGYRDVTELQVHGPMDYPFANIIERQFALNALALLMCMGKYTEIVYILRMEVIL